MLTLKKMLEVLKVALSPIKPIWKGVKAFWSDAKKDKTKTERAVRVIVGTLAGMFALNLCIYVLGFALIITPAPLIAKILLWLGKSGYRLIRYGLHYVRNRHTMSKTGKPKRKRKDRWEPSQSKQQIPL